MKMGLLSKEQLRELIKEKDIKTVSDIQNMLKEMFSETIQEMLEAEPDTELGYPKNGDKPEGSANRRNGHSSKKSVRNMVKWRYPFPATGRVNSSQSLLKKRQREISGIKEQIIGLYAKGVSVPGYPSPPQSLVRRGHLSDADLKRYEQDYALDTRVAIAPAPECLRRRLSGRDPF